jgi:hypothetical protein
MRKVRDFDAELRELDQRRKQIQQRKIQQYGELIEATGADALDPNLLAGALLAAVAEKNGTTLAAWTDRGARFFRETDRKSSRRPAGAGTGGKATAPVPQQA